MNNSWYSLWMFGLGFAHSSSFVPSLCVLSFIVCRKMMKRWCSDISRQVYQGIIPGPSSDWENKRKQNAMIPSIFKDRLCSKVTRYFIWKTSIFFFGLCESSFPDDLSVQMFLNFIIPGFCIQYSSSSSILFIGAPCK